MDDLDAFIANVKRLLEKRGWNQNDLARKAGIRATTLSAMMRRLHDPGFAKMIAIAEALGTTVAALLERDQDYFRHLENVRHSPPEDRRFIFSIAERSAKYGPKE